ncbi:hypothetical protein K438DRAFT_1760005 [Mycena galopus ATCC 62051]|nr:hypothetical protein K438DRAFT_1760005 [Mycena galopus ATCC 62051]
MDADADHEARTFFMKCNQISNKAQFLMNTLPNVETEAVEHLHRQLNAIKVILLDLNNAADEFLRLVKSSWMKKVQPDLHPEFRHLRSPGPGTWWAKERRWRCGGKLGNQLKIFITGRLMVLALIPRLVKSSSPHRVFFV